jgi:thymidylate synthase (FAD)
MDNIKLYFKDSIYLLKMALTEQQKKEITEQQSQKNTTKRVISPELEKILYEAIPVLDHGFIRVVDYMGDDSSVVQSARVSYGKGTKKVSTDSGLIKYLMRHRHSTPFEMCEIKYHVKLPIFIARQWIRHRTANVNEYSARYSILDKEFYMPSKDNLAAQSTNNRQGRGDLINGKQADEILNILKKDAEQTYNNYELMLNERFDGSTIKENNKGLARELARMNLTLNTYTQWYWKTDLLNLLNFLSLRSDSHAQYEIRAYADVMVDTLKKWVPITFEAFMDYRVGGMELSSKGKSIIQKMIKGEPCDFDSSKLSKREWNELMESFGFKEKIL